MADLEGKQPVRNSEAGDLVVGIYDSTNTSQIDPRDIALAGTPVSASAPIPVAPATANSAFNVQQSTASSLNATVVQGTASNLKTEVSQSTASSLNATVVQGTATNLKAQAEVYQGGTAVGSGNGMYIQPTAGAIFNVNLTGGATSLSDYDGQAAAGNGGAAAHHDYGPTAQAQRINSVVCSSTTPASYYIKVDPAGGTPTVIKWVAFTSESSPTVVVDTSDYHIPLGATVRVTKLNKAKAAASIDIHSTINLEY